MTGTVGSGSLAENDEDPSSFGRDTAIVQFTCDLAIGVEPLDVVTNTSSALWTSRVGTPGSGDFPPINDDATATISGITIDKTVLPTTAVVGQILTYQVEVTLPGGTSTGVRLDDLLPAGLAFVDCLSVSADTGMTTSIGTFADACNDPTNPTVTSSGQNIGFTLGTVTNPGSAIADAGTVTFTYTAVPLNTTAIYQGRNRLNRATWTWSGGSLVDQSTVTIREPVLRVVKETIPAMLPPVDAGDTVTFRITVDHAAPGLVPAYDATLTDVIPAGLNPVVATLDCAGGSLLPSSCGFAGTTLSASWPVFPTAGVTVITFDATVDISVAPGTSITNEALVQWTSLPGTIIGPISPYNANSCERTSGLPPFPFCGSGNDYNVLDPATVSIASVGLAKAVVATSEPSTGDARHRPGIDDLTIGETATFHVTATIPEGTTPQVIITDTLPYTNGVMEVVSAQMFTLGGNLLPDNVPPTISISDTQLADGLDDTVTFNFGRVINVPDGAVTIDDLIVVEVVGRLVDVAANTNGDPLSNDASVQFGAGLNSTASAGVDVVEPLLRVVKTGSATSGDAGDIVVYTVTIDHVPPTPGSTADAFDLVMTDAIPVGMTYVAASLNDTGAVSADSLSEASGTITAVWNDFPLGSVGEFTCRHDQPRSPGRHQPQQHRQRPVGHPACRWRSQRTCPHDIGQPQRVGHQSRDDQGGPRHLRAVHRHRNQRSRARSDYRRARDLSLCHDLSRGSDAIVLDRGSTPRRNRDPVLRQLPSGRGRRQSRGSVAASGGRRRDPERH